MTEQAQDAETIFLAALDRATPQERAEYVQGACAGNVELLRRVSELLDCHDATKGPLDAPPAGITDTIDGPSKNECAGTVIGPYKLLQQIGEGGFGVVFMAEQTQPVQRKVALKVIKAGMDSNQVIARFEAERQALAVMDHVNIARVFDGGTTEAGRPYFVMELVHGVPITKYCDDNRLTPRERLELFVPVCQAIQHAHQKGIIHRDIKPSNVMVTLYDGKPVPKVIDFGVAKATEQKLTERTLFTQYGAMVGTFEYMSPEQAEMSALGVDTRSDIFSLGVLLYELLTGSTPLERKRIREAAFGEIVRMIKEEEPPKPSTRLSDSGEALASISAQRHMEPTKLAKLVRGELDWIVMKSLEKDRNRRYESANSFAADLQRYLNDETVQACPPSAWYRFRKFARRNKGALAASLAVVMVVLLSFIGLAANYWMVKREKAQKEQALDNALREKERADANLVRARKAVKDYLTEVAGNPLLREADFHDLRRKLLESAIPFYQEFLKQQTDDPDLEAERGRAYGDLAMVREDLGQLDQALADYEQQRVIFARLAPDVQSKAVFRHGLAISYRNLANVYHAMSQPAKAQEAQRKAISIMEALTDEYPNAAPYRQELAGVLNNLGISLRGAARLEEAKKLHLRALELCERLKAESPDLPAYRKDLARCHHSLGTLYGVMHQYPKALTSLQQAADLLEGLAKEFPGEPEYRQHWAGSLTNKSFFLFDTGRVPECLKAQEDALQIEEKLADDFSSVPGYRRSAEQSRINLSEMLRAMRRNQDALAALDKAIAALDRLAQQWPKVPENLQSLALAHNNRSLVLRQLNRNEEALESCRKAQALQEDLTNRYPDVLRYAQDLGMTYNNTGDFLNELGRSVEAITVLEKAIALREKQARKHKDVPAYAVDLAAAYLNMGASQMAQRRFEVALDWFKKTLAEIEPVLAREGRLTEARSVACNAHANRGMALDNLSRYPEAVAEFDKSLTFDDGQKRIPIRLQRASTLVRSGDYARAAAEADALAGDADANSGNIYDAACVYALSAAVKRNDAQRTEQYAVRAVGLLRRAVEKGYKDAAHMKKDPDLEALRGREDFKRLLSDLEKPKE